METIEAQILMRRDTLAGYAAKGVVPANGEPIAIADPTGLVVDIRIGDGKRLPAQLPALSKGDDGPPGTDGLGLSAIDDPTYAWAVTREGRASLLIRHDGRVEMPRGVNVFDGDSAATLGSLSSNGLSFAITRNGRIAELALDTSGRVPAWAARAIVKRGTALAGLAGWGDSITAGDGGTNGYTQLVADTLGKQAYNGGWSGQTADQVAARQGGVPAVMTFPDNTIPKSGAATVTLDVDPIAPMNGQSVTSLRGSAQGVSGTLTSDGTTHTFTRDQAGQFDVALNGGTKFVPEAGVKYRAYDAVFWAGRNAAASDTQKVVTMTRAMVDYHQIVNPRFLVLQILPGDGWGDEKPLNWALSQEFPENYVRAADWLRTDEAAAAIGYTLTSDDRSDIAAGLTPRGYRLDAVHPNTTGRRAIAALITNEFTTRGWN